MSRLYAQVDAARFYASAPTLCSPELRAKSLVVTTHSGYKGVPIALNIALYIETASGLGSFVFIFTLLTLYSYERKMTRREQSE